MHLKFMKLFLVMILIPAFLLTSCKKSAAPEIDISQIQPTDEVVTMQQEALDNTSGSDSGTVPTATPAPDDGDQATEPEETEETEATEETPVETVEATPEPTENPTAEPVATAQPVIQTPGKHIVQAGETLYHIAVTYGSSVEAISQANSITNPSLIHPGQELTIPAGTTNVTPSSPNPVTTSGNVYIVKQGDNLFRIGLKFGYDQYYLARYNGIDNVSMIYVGQQIRIP